jgi:hypothetical protein
MPAGYPALIETTWAAQRHIDGCVDDDEVTSTCMAVLLTDQSDGVGYYALLTTAADRGNYSFVQPDNSPIVLAPIPVPQQVEVAPGAEAHVTMSMRVSLQNEGLYLGPAECARNVVMGYRLYVQTVRGGDPAPVDRVRDNGRSSSGWQLAEGGEAPRGQPLNLGSAAELSVACTPNADVYLAASLVFDSGFETAHVSQNSTVVPCPR